MIPALLPSSRLGPGGLARRRRALEALEKSRKSGVWQPTAQRAVLIYEWADSATQRGNGDEPLVRYGRGQACSGSGGPLRESNWKRSVRWRAARVAAGVPDVRVHDLRHTAASLWLAAGADPKVVQRVLGHATAAMTMDLYGHLVDASLWQAARLIGGTTGASEPPGGAFERNPSRGGMRKTLRSWAFVMEPPWGIEPQTYALRARFGLSSLVHRVPYPLLIRVPMPCMSATVQGRC